jgi:hypothetical protein
VISLILERSKNIHFLFVCWSVGLLLKRFLQFHDIIELTSPFVFGRVKHVKLKHTSFSMKFVQIYRQSETVSLCRQEREDKDTRKLKKRDRDKGEIERMGDVESMIEKDGKTENFDFLGGHNEYCMFFLHFLEASRCSAFTSDPV